MAALDFPNSPTNGQQYSAPNGAVYTWDGAAWTVSGVISTGTAAGGDLTGSYPNPTVVSAANQFTVKGNQLNIGATVTKGSLGYDEDGGISLVANQPWGPQDPARSSWFLMESTGGAWGDVWQVIRRAPGAAAGTVTTPLVIGANGRVSCLLADLSVQTPMLAAHASVRTVGVIGAVVPVNWSSVTQNQWLTVLTTGSITTRGGPVLITPTVGCYAVCGQTAITGIYIGHHRSGSLISQWKHDLQSSAAAYMRVPITIPAFVDHPPAGTYTYGLQVYQPPGAFFGTATDNQGYFEIAELA